jgi:uncharacterized membrane protein
MEIKDNILASAAYILGVPALYIVMTEKRRERQIGFHGAQAFLLWLAMLVIFFLSRLVINLIWSIKYIPQLQVLEWILVLAMGSYALFCGWRSFLGQDFRIPH